MEIVQLFVKLVFYSCVFYGLSSAAVMCVSGCDAVMFSVPK